jgi:endonuclease/exonuclease/phosphatase family metal-dependent hydrolase
MKLVDFIARLLSWLVMAGLLGSYTAPFVDPNTLPLSSLLGLAYHYLLVAAILLLLYWAARRKRLFLPLLALLLAGYPFMTRYYGMNARADADTPCDVEILSYNVHHLLPCTPGGNGEMEKYIRHFPGDIACLQDFPRAASPGRLFPGYPHLHAARDLLILSRRPILHRGTLPLEQGSAAACIYADILSRGGDTLRVYCLHLESFRFDGTDRRLFLDFPDLHREALSSGLRSITSHLVAANKRRARQAATVKAHANRSPHPVILCGDFNDTPLSYTYTLLKKGMHDSFIEKGRGVGNTYIGLFPSFRIDHILHDPSFQTLAYSRDTPRLSDHYPLRAKITPRR